MWAGLAGKPDVRTRKLENIFVTLNRRHVYIQFFINLHVCVQTQTMNAKYWTLHQNQAMWELLFPLWLTSTS